MPCNAPCCKALERHLQGEQDGSLIDTVASGVRNVYNLHKRAVLHVVVAGSPGGRTVTRASVMRRIGDVKHFSPERKAKSLVDGELLLQGKIPVDQPGAP